jgi:hypothetical protein
MDSDPDPGGLKTCGPYVSESGTLISTESKKRACHVPPPCPPWLGPSVAAPRPQGPRGPGPRWSAGWPAGGTRDAPTHTNIQTQGCGSGSATLDPDWIRIQSGQWIWNPDSDPDPVPGGQK